MAWLVAVFAAPVFAPKAAFSEEPETWYVEKYAAGDVPVRVEQLWSRGPLFRAESVVAGHPIVTIVRGDQYIIIDRIRRQGVTIERAPEAIAESEKHNRPFGNELQGLLAAGGEFVKVEDFGGLKCDLHRLTNTSGRREVCASQDAEKLPILLRVWMRKSNRRVEGRYVNWNKALGTPAYFFEPDPRILLKPITYQEYVKNSGAGLDLPAPPQYRDLLHGSGDS